MSEGKVLKTKFDDIFAATRYSAIAMIILFFGYTSCIQKLNFEFMNSEIRCKFLVILDCRYIKALEAIRKFRKEQASEVKIFKTDLEHLKANKDKADEVHLYTAKNEPE